MAVAKGVVAKAVAKEVAVRADMKAVAVRVVSMVEVLVVVEKVGGKEEVMKEVARVVEEVLSDKLLVDLEGVKVVAVKVVAKEAKRVEVRVEGKVEEMVEAKEVVVRVGGMEGVEKEGEKVEVLLAEGMVVVSMEAETEVEMEVEKGLVEVVSEGVVSEEVI